MDESGPLWSCPEVCCPESLEEMKAVLLQTTLQLQSERARAFDEMTRNEENLRRLLHLLNTAYQERDEARCRFQDLLGKIMPSFPAESPSIIRPSLPQTLTNPVNSEWVKHHSIDSFPVIPPLNKISSMGFPNTETSDWSSVGHLNQTLVQEIESSSNTCTHLPEIAVSDEAAVVIENLLGGRPLPQKGELLQAVMGAGPLLQTQLLADRLPRWRNPPLMGHSENPRVITSDSHFRKNNMIRTAERPNKSTASKCQKLY